MPSPSAQPCSVEPTADQNAPSPNWLTSSESAAEAGGMFVSATIPPWTTSSQSTSSTATAASGASMSYSAPSQITSSSFGGFSITLYWTA